MNEKIKKAFEKKYGLTLEEVSQYLDEFITETTDKPEDIDKRNQEILKEW